MFLHIQFSKPKKTTPLDIEVGCVSFFIDNLFTYIRRAKSMSFSQLDNNTERYLFFLVCVGGECVNIHLFKCEEKWCVDIVSCVCVVAV